MEPAFENRFLTSRKMYTEYIRKIVTGPRPVTAVVLWVFYAFVLLFAVYHNIFWERAFLLLAWGLVLLMILFMPNWTTWLTFRNIRKQNDGVQPETVVTFGEAIEMREGMVHYTIEYRKLVRTVRLKHSYMLLIGKRNGIILDPNSFTKGTFEEFKTFLGQKCPDLTIMD